MPTNLNKYISSEIQGAIAVQTLAGTVKNTTAASWAAGKVTLTSNAHGFLVGDVVTVAGVSAPLLGSFTVTDADVNTLSYVLVADPGVIADGVGTVVFTTPAFLSDMPITGGTSGATATAKASAGTGDASVVTFANIGGSAMFVDGETLTGRNVTAVVDTVAGNLESGLIGAGQPKTATTIQSTSAGIVKTVTTGTRTTQEVLVASRNFTAKQSA